MNQALLYANGGTVELASHRFGRCDAPAVLPNVPSLAAIQQFERALLQMPQLDIPVTHYFAPGMYARQITIPAGAAVTGKLHRTGHLNFLMQGEIEVWTEEGMQRLRAPCVVVSQPGTKRVGYAITDTVWVTAHATEETDIEAIEAQLIEPETPVIDHEDVKCLS